MLIRGHGRCGLALTVTIILIVIVAAAVGLMFAQVVDDVRCQRRILVVPR